MLTPLRHTATSHVWILFCGTQNDVLFSCQLTSQSMGMVLKTAWKIPAGQLALGGLLYRIMKFDALCLGYSLTVGAWVSPQSCGLSKLSAQPGLFSSLWLLASATLHINPLVDTMACFPNTHNSLWHACYDTLLCCDSGIRVGLFRLSQCSSSRDVMQCRQKQLPRQYRKLACRTCSVLALLLMPSARCQSTYLGFGLVIAAGNTESLHVEHVPC